MLHILSNVLVTIKTINFCVNCIYKLKVIFFNFFVKTLELLSLRLEGEETLEYRCVCRPHTEKFNVVSGDDGRTRKCDFFVLDQK